MKIITYTIELLEPLLATALMGDPNSSQSLNYIPGSMIRGMVIARFLKQQGNTNKDDITRDPTCRRLFFDSSTRYIHAYPYNPQLFIRTLPTPRSLRQFKGDQDTEAKTPIFDTCHEDWDEEERREWEKQDTLKPVQTPFLHIANSEVTFYNPEKTLTIHTQRDPQRGRSHKERGEIFCYEALADRQWFQGAILVDHDQDESVIRTLLEEVPIGWLGRSRSAGYGRIQMTVNPTSDTWREVHHPIQPQPASTLWTLTLLSDALLYDNDGQPTTTLDTSTLASLLNVPESTMSIDKNRTFTSSVQHGGFNAKWKLPLPQSSMLAAGCVITFTLTTPLDTAHMQQLEAQGIGARRAEGFGRVVFNWIDTMVLTTQDKGSLTIDTEKRPEPSQLSAVEVKMAQQMAKRLLEAKIEQAILNYVKDIKQIDHPPKTSQLNRIRTLARQNIARGSAGAEEVLRQYNQFKQTADRQFEQARVNRGVQNQPSLATWIDEILKNPQNLVKRKLKIVSPLPTIAEQQTRIDEDLAASVALRLLAAVMEQAVRDKQQQGKKEQQA